MDPAFFLGVGEPGVELGEGGGGELVPFEGSFCVLVCLLGLLIAGGSNCLTVSMWIGEVGGHSYR